MSYLLPKLNNYNPYKDNFFDGYHLKYYITPKLLSQIQELIGTYSFNLFTKHEISIPCIANNYYILPIGLFSNKRFHIMCTWLKTNRQYNIKLNSDIQSNIILREPQKIVFNHIRKNCEDIIKTNKTPVYLNLIAQCSFGKTILSLYLINFFKYKTIIIVHNLYMAKQWGTQIQKNLLNINCYVSTKGVKKFLDLDEKIKSSFDILIFPYKHLSNSNFLTYISNSFSMAIIDEQHIYNLEENVTLQKFLSFYSFQIFISLTATPRRINTLYFGKEINVDLLLESNICNFQKFVYEIQLSNDKYNDFIKPEIYDFYISKKKNIRNKQDMLKLVLYKKQCLAADDNRIKTIINEVINSYLYNDNVNNPKILILVSFINDIDKLYQLLISELLIKFKDKINFYKQNHESNQYIQNLLNLILNNLIEQNINFENIYDENLSIIQNNNFNDEFELLKKLYLKLQHIYKIYASANKNQFLELKNQLHNMSTYILIGTDNYLGTGIDIPGLNILHLTNITSNERNIIQYAGRVSRNNDETKHYIYYYNINSFQQKIINDISYQNEINISKEIDIIKKKLIQKNWEYNIKCI